MRAALQDIALNSTGTPIALPAGTICVTPESAVHSDPENYADPHTFEPFRFAELRAGEGEDKRSGLKHQFVSTSVSYVPFGHGKHAWYALPHF